jgi:UDP-N-acetylmuramate dehydrogenase
LKIQENILLAPLTTLRVGGRARFFIDVTSLNDLLEGIQLAKSLGLPVFLLGGGSNVVVSDEGFRGVVLRISIMGISETHSGQFEVAAGENWDGFVAHAISRNCGGIETLSGIPGTVGAAPVQNIGAYGQEISSTLESVKVLDLSHVAIKELSKSECKFSYRTSIFNTLEPGRFVILGVKFRLIPGALGQVIYTDVKQYLSGKRQATLTEIRQAVQEVRRTKGMLLVGDADCYSVGSFFKNPIITGDQLLNIRTIAEKKGLGPIPDGHRVSDTMTKFPAAWLVEVSGIKKGHRMGSASVSLKHSLAIINNGRASAQEIIDLMKHIQDSVRNVFDVNLEAEPKFVGFS